MTGESVPVEVGPGSPVTGATINTSGRLLVRATRVGAETTLAQMGRLVAQAQTGKAPIARLADRISAVFVPVVLAIAVLTFAAWLLAAGPDVTGPELRAAFTAAVAVLVIACPCALGLATPVGLLTGTGRGAQLGILIRGPQVLEDTRTVDTILLDKTGTVTSGHLAVDSSGCLHTVQRGGSPAAGRRGRGRLRAPDRARDRRCRTGRGARRPAGRPTAAGSPPSPTSVPRPAAECVGTVEGRPVVAGRTGWLAGERRRARPRHSSSALRSAEDSGATAIWVAVDGEAAGLIALRGHDQAGLRGGGQPAQGAGAAAHAADRRQRRRGRPGGSRRRNSRRRTCSRACCPRARWTPSAGCRPPAQRWPWPATA